jgi:hypothetical protein
MYFIDLRALKRDLIANRLSEAERFKYWLAPVVLFALPSRVALEGGQSWNRTGWLVWAFGTLVMLSGNIYCFHQNGASSGRQYLERYLSLS